MKNKLLETKIAMKEELTKQILSKIDKIREKIISEEGSNKSYYIKMLIDINDELEDVLYNWDIDTLYSDKNEFEDDFEEDLF